MRPYPLGDGAADRAVVPSRLDAVTRLRPHPHHPSTSARPPPPQPGPRGWRVSSTATADEARRRARSHLRDVDDAVAQQRLALRSGDLEALGRLARREPRLVLHGRRHGGFAVLRQRATAARATSRRQSRNRGARSRTDCGGSTSERLRLGSRTGWVAAMLPACAIQVARRSGRSRECAAPESRVSANIQLCRMGERSVGTRSRDATTRLGDCRSRALSSHPPPAIPTVPARRAPMAGRWRTWFPMTYSMKSTEIPIRIVRRCDRPATANARPPSGVRRSAEAPLLRAPAARAAIEADVGAAVGATNADTPDAIAVVAATAVTAAPAMDAAARRWCALRVEAGAI